MMTHIVDTEGVVRTAIENLLRIPFDGETDHGIEVPIARAQTYRNAAGKLKKERQMRFRTKVVGSRGVLQVWRLA